MRRFVLIAMLLSTACDSNVTPRRLLEPAPPSRPDVEALDPPTVEDPSVAWFENALSLADHVSTHGCPRNLLGSASHPFHEAPAACDVYLAIALTSLAIEHPERRERASEALGRLRADVLSPRAGAAFRSTGTGLVAGRALPKSVLYRGYALLVIAASEQLATERLEDHEGDALADALAHDLEASASGYLPSFGRDRIWPCDHAPAAAALILRARRYPERGAAWDAAGRALVRRMLDGMTAEDGFPTRIDRAGIAVEPLPRGTVLAFAAGFLVPLGHDGDAPARRFADVLANDFCDAEVGACREWPRGVEHPPDAVSGPIVAGFGVGASALAIGATRALEDDALHLRLVETADEVGITVFLDDPDRYPLENAIYLASRAVRPWPDTVSSQ